MQYKCILSLGIRCFTEIFLKEMKLKKFSSPFDGLYLSSINDVIYLLEHKIIENDLIHTQDYKKYNSLNNKWGFRSIHLKLDNLIMNKSNSIEANYHYATFAHHNLKDKNTINHFKRCFNRLEIIENKKIKTLFCLFILKNYNGYVPIDNDQIKKLSIYLYNKYNCHLLVIYFVGKNEKNENKKKYSLKIKNEQYSMYEINDNGFEFKNVKNELIEIFNNFNIDQKNLLSYEDINKV
jgi:hypothetical protein